MPTKPTYSLFSCLLDVVAPRFCVVCGGRLSMAEQFLCAHCNLHLPRTDHAKDFYGNILAQRFWGRVSLERAFALVRYLPHAGSANPVYRLKYGENPYLGEEMGRLMAAELAPTTFFDGITALMPVPLARQRQRERGYNQSRELARGVAAVCGLPVVDKAVERTSFSGSQTQLRRRERNENVANAFRLVEGTRLSGQHVLLIDDVVTTGATMTACIRAMQEAGDVRVSILAWGMAGE